MLYSFKIYYNDGTSEIGGAMSSTPEGLWFDFDGLIDWDEYDKLEEKNLTSDEVVKMAFKVYKKHLKPYHRIDIINIKTNEIISSYEVKRWKQ